MKKKTDYYLVLDLEATCCDRGTIPNHEMEIIEIGASIFAFHSCEVISTFQSFVRPKRNPILTTYCHNLTSITQKDIDGAEGFVYVMSQFERWLMQHETSRFYSWGNYDEKQLRLDCSFHRVPYPIKAPHYNLKTEFLKHMRSRHSLSIPDALSEICLTFEGFEHRALDDVVNECRILKHLIEQGLICNGTERT